METSDAIDQMEISVNEQLKELAIAAQVIDDWSKLSPKLSSLLRSVKRKVRLTKKTGKR